MADHHQLERERKSAGAGERVCTWQGNQKRAGEEVTYRQINARAEQARAER